MKEANHPSTGHFPYPAELPEELPMTSDDLVNRLLRFEVSNAKVQVVDRENRGDNVLPTDLSGLMS